MKNCSICKIPKDESEFSFKNKTSGKRHSQCKVCKKLIDSKYYRDSAKRRSIVREDAKYGILRARTFARRVRKKSKCSKCGENRWYVLDFHHISNKDYSIAHMSNSGYSIKRIKSEMKKCIILCANCHREEHYIKGAVAEMD